MFGIFRAGRMIGRGLTSGGGIPGPLVKLFWMWTAPGAILLTILYNTVPEMQEGYLAHPEHEAVWWLVLVGTGIVFWTLVAIIRRIMRGSQPAPGTVEEQRAKLISKLRKGLD